MSRIRQDPTTKEWVIVASERARRPHDSRRPRPPRHAKAADPACPFCPGQEAATPPELMRIPAGDGTGWAVRVIANKFPVLDGRAVPARREYGPLFREMDGAGHHEVIVETPVHDRKIARMVDAEVEAILRAYQARLHALARDPHLKLIIVFKNHGETAGTSLTHPHSQLVATPVAPAQIRRKYEVAIAHYDDTGRCLYCDLVEAELRARERIVWETDAFVVFEPFASRVPFETWIAPKRHQPSFARVSAEDLAALATVLRRTLAALDAELGDHDFNYVLHTAPTGDENKDYYLWHIQILPRLTTSAGFELGSGMFVTTVLPEESAAALRDAFRAENHAAERRHTVSSPPPAAPG